MNYQINKLLFTNKHKILLEPNIFQQPDEVIAALQVELAVLGYTMDKNLTNTVKTLSDDDLMSFYENILKIAQESKGAHVKYLPLFKKFPHHLVIDDFDYLLKRFFGHLQNLGLDYNLDTKNTQFLSCGHLIDLSLFDLEEFGACPICQMQVNEIDEKNENSISLKDTTPLTIISLMTQGEYLTYIENLCYSQTPLSEENKEFIYNVLKNDFLSIYLVVNFYNVVQKETLTLLICEFFKEEPNAKYALKEHITTMTDILRIATYFSDGDVSLKENTRFKLKNKERVFIKELFEKVIIQNIERLQEHNTTTDLFRNKERFKRLFYAIHALNYKNKFKELHKLNEKLINDERELFSLNREIEIGISTLNTLNKNPNFESIIDKNNVIQKLLENLKKNPGMFGRYLDVALRFSNEDPHVVEEFQKIIKLITTINLIKMLEHFHKRTETQPQRFFIPKGNVAKIKVSDDHRKLLSDEIVDKLTSSIENELKNRFAKGESMGHVYISPKLKNYMLPLQQKTASKQLNVVPRGSKIDFDKKSNFLRMFVYWKENDTRVDVDLSAVCFDHKFNYTGHLSYTRLSDKNQQAFHSGDIQSAPNGASEFIDFNIEKCLENNIRYIVMNVFSFTGQKFSTFECFSGFMEREEIQSGNAYEPKTVKNVFDLNSESKHYSPLVFDLKEKQAIFIDLSLNVERGLSNIEGHSVGIESLLKFACDSSQKTNLFDLFNWHAKQKALSIDYKKDKNKKYTFCFDKNIVRNLDEIISIWLK